ncbi:hypothetical protein JOC93_000780 [Priestia taiwanensis]|uniref:Uncharacterized protein n=1 Tax=Priestia taiwanensis TaxID=1347902 RepID=A0A917ANC5_9BACI|nr:hypothetical protein [Priestia taiwanensis]GGE59863.1 hypothetical protein GCM10007140_07790 [Priestia taiwanensis]
MEQPIMDTYKENQETTSFEVILDKMTAHTFYLFLVLAIPVILHMLYSLFSN